MSIRIIPHPHRPDGMHQVLINLLNQSLDAVDRARD